MAELIRFVALMKSEEKELIFSWKHTTFDNYYCYNYRTLSFLHSRHE
jgi:hypothetical protein